MDVETETHQDWQIHWVSRPRLIQSEKFLGCRDCDSSRLRNFLVVETETHRDCEISGMSRSRLIETEKFLGCRDRDSSRPGNLMDVETGQKMSVPRLRRDSRRSLVLAIGLALSRL